MAAVALVTLFNFRDCLFYDVTVLLDSSLGLNVLGVLVSDHLHEIPSMKNGKNLEKWPL